jgi:hypothetical protein
MNKYLVAYALLLFSFTALCQTEMLIEDLATLIIENGNESESEQIIEMITELIQTPLDINNSTETNIVESGLFTPFQVFGILKYREKYGPFFSIYELAAIPGFNIENLKNISPLLTVSPILKVKTYKSSKGMLLSNMSIRNPESAAYFSSDSLPSLYPGSPIKFAHRFNYKMGKHWSLGSTYEKDPGEQWILNKRPEHLSAYLQYKSDYFIKHLIIGNFRIHRGLGLVHGLGFNSRSNGVNLNGFRGAYAKSFASTSEYRYMRGIFIEAGSKNWRTDIFLSHVPVDVSLFNITQKTELFEKTREGGLHRTVNEINGSDLALQQSAGISINRSFSRLNIGICSSHSGIKLTSIGIDSIVPVSLNNDYRSNHSIFATGFGNNYELFGEFALDRYFKHSILLGGSYDLNPAISGTFSYRRYQSDFTSQTPNAFGSGGDPENETGVNIGLAIVPAPYASLYLNTDIFKNLKKSSSDDLLTFRSYNTMRFKYDWKNGTKLELRITSKEQGNMGDKEEITRFRFHLENTYSEELRMSSRIEFSRLKTTELNSNGLIMYQQFTSKLSDWISLTYRILLFNSPEWKNRIYTYEPGVKYSFSFPAMHGKGSRNILVSSLKIGEWGTLRAKIGYTLYSHKRSTGSANDIRSGNHILDTELQLQVDF